MLHYVACLNHHFSRIEVPASRNPPGFHAEPGELYGSRSQASAPRPPGAHGVSGAGGRAASARPARRSRWPRRPSRGPHPKWRTCGAPGTEREVGLQWPEREKISGGCCKWEKNIRNGGTFHCLTDQKLANVGI